MKNIDKIIEVLKNRNKNIQEDAPTNNVGSGNVAGYDKPLGDSDSLKGVDFRKRKQRKLNLFYRSDLMKKRKEEKKNIS